MRLLPLFASFLLPVAAQAAPLAGTFSSPLGNIAIKEGADGGVVGTVLDPKNPCGFPKGTSVLNGFRLDDSVAGTFKACKIMTDTCAGTLEGDAVLLITRSGALLSGA